MWQLSIGHLRFHTLACLAHFCQQNILGNAQSNVPCLSAIITSELFWFRNSEFSLINQSTVMTLSFQTDWSRKKVQTQIRLLLEEQSDQRLHCLLFHLHHFDKYPKVWPLCLNFR